MFFIDIPCLSRQRLDTARRRPSRASIRALREPLHSIRAPYFYWRSSSCIRTTRGMTYKPERNLDDVFHKFSVIIFIYVLQ